jgi:ribosomal biogenesis protein LAS1
MQWLLHNYFLPLLHPSTLPKTQGAMLRLISPLLDQYKTLLTGDVSLIAHNRQQIRVILRDIERWVAEAKVAAETSSVNDDWDFDHQCASSMDIDPKERWALDRLCDGLLEQGALVPKSAKCASFTIFCSTR